MNIISKRSALVFVLVLTVTTVGGVSAKPKETVTARVLIGECLKSENLSVPINRSQWRTTVSGIGGGGTSVGLRGPDRCNYSYDLLATRIDRNHVRLTLKVTTSAWAVEKTIILMRGKNIDLQLEHDVTLIAGF